MKKPLTLLSFLFLTLTTQPGFAQVDPNTQVDLKIPIIECNTKEGALVEFFRAQQGSTPLLEMAINGEWKFNFVLNPSEIKKNNENKLELCTGRCGFRGSYFWKLKINKETGTGSYEHKDRRRNWNFHYINKQSEKLELENCKILESLN